MDVAPLGLLGVSRRDWDGGKTVPNWETGTRRLPYEFPPWLPAEQKERISHPFPQCRAGSELPHAAANALAPLRQAGNPDSAAFRDMRAV